MTPWPGPTHPTGPAGPAPAPSGPPPGGPTPTGPVTPAPEDPIAPVPPAHPLVAIEVLLSEALRLAESEIARSSTLAERAVEVGESERTRARIRIALTAAGRWSAAAGVESPARRRPADGAVVSVVGGRDGGPVVPPSEGGRAGGVSPVPGTPVQFVCTDKTRHQRRYPHVSFQGNGGIVFKCSACGRDLQLRADRFLSVLGDLRAAGISEVDISALPH